VLADGRIEAIGPRAAGAGAGAKVIDGTGLLALPGLVNAHTHSPENCLRGMFWELPLEPWLWRMYESSGLYDADDHYATALAGAVEMLKTGTTSVVDHLWMTPANVEAAEGALRAYRDVGIRAAVAPLTQDVEPTLELGAAYGVDVSDALLTRCVTLPPAAESVAVLEELLTRWHGAAGGRIQILAGPSGLQWSSEELLQGSAEAARRHGSGIHMHLLETRIQDATCRLRFGVSAVAALDRLGILGPDCSLAHSVWVDADDIALIAERDAIVVHNPAANLRLSSGRSPIPELVRAGVRVGLGTDGSASSDSQTLWSCLRIAGLLHNESDPGRLTARDVLGMGTTGGASVFGHEGLGTLDPGAPADMVLVDRHGPGLVGAIDLEPSLFLSDDGRSVRHVFVAGRLVVEDGRCLTADEGEVVERMREQVSKRRGGYLRRSEGAERAVAQLGALRRAVNARPRPETSDLYTSDP
jgi:cytosine/adenosine deaminase-related metal-dependent hydrolase